MNSDPRFFRTCQECGHKQQATIPAPNADLPNSYLNTKCKRCKSTALDYGTYHLDSED